MKIAPNEEIDQIVNSINESLQVYSSDDTTVEELSQLIFTKLVGNGVSARIIQYTYNSKPFQSVQYYKQKAWFNFDYSGLDMFFQPVYNRTLDPQNIVKEEMVDVQYAIPDTSDEAEDEDVDVTQEQINTGVTNWISNHLSNFTSIITTAVNNYLAAHTADFKGEKGNDGATGATGPQGPGFTSGTYQIKKLIEKKTVSNVATASFSNLDGDTDEIYVIFADVNLQYVSGDTQLMLVPNSSNSNMGGLEYCFYDNAGRGYINQTVLQLCRTHNSESIRAIVDTAVFYAKSGKKRLFKSKWIGKTANYFISADEIEFWANTADNVTRIDISTNNNTTFSGTIKLYKLVDMVVS